ncbi:MAG: hypothetical protein WC413_00530 [Candidatus Nanoarchaeia archaeon]
MNKKAIGHHLDWMLAIGLFMVYTLFVIVMLKPGIDPLYKGSVLLDLVQDGLMKDINWEITKVPLNVKLDGGQCSGDPVAAKLTFPFEWLDKNTKVYSKTKSIILASSISGDYLNFNIASYLINGNLPATNDELFIFNSLDFNIAGGGSSGNCIVPITNYQYGIAETIKGICDDGNCGDKINSLFGKNYEDLKTEWNFPPNKEFSIQIGENKFPQNLIPPASADVFVRQIPNYILKQNGELESITITIMAW